MISPPAYLLKQETGDSPSAPSCLSFTAKPSPDLWCAPQIVSPGCPLLSDPTATSRPVPLQQPGGHETRVGQSRAPLCFELLPIAPRRTLVPSVPTCCGRGLPHRPPGHPLCAPSTLDIEPPFRLFLCPQHLHMLSLLPAALVLFLLILLLQACPSFRSPWSCHFLGTASLAAAPAQQQGAP